MKTIWEYELKGNTEEVLNIPVSAEILDIQLQKGKPCIWMLVETENIKEDRFFEIFFTGEVIPYNNNITRKYIGTYQTKSEDLVFHVFERINATN